MGGGKSKGHTPFDARTATIGAQLETLAMQVRLGDVSLEELPEKLKQLMEKVKKEVK